jgi:hypothetical protein
MQTPLRDEDGYNGEELNAAEERLGFKLPAALREAYMLFGRRADLCGTMNFLQPPDQLDTYEDTGLLTYHAENQGAWERYIRPADLYVEDPPVTRSCEWGHEEHVLGVAWTERLSVAERRFARLGFPPLPTDESACTWGHRWYAGEDVIVLIGPFLRLTEEQETRTSPWHRPRSRASLTIRGRTPEIVDALSKDLPTEWSHWEWDW